MACIGESVQLGWRLRRLLFRGGFMYEVIIQITCENWETTFTELKRTLNWKWEGSFWTVLMGILGSLFRVSIQLFNCQFILTSNRRRLLIDSTFKTLGITFLMLLRFWHCTLAMSCYNIIHSSKKLRKVKATNT
jgi:hypothetical protein